MPASLPPSLPPPLFPFLPPSPSPLPFFVRSQINYVILLQLRKKVFAENLEKRSLQKNFP